MSADITQKLGLAFKDHFRTYFGAFPLLNIIGRSSREYILSTRQNTHVNPLWMEQSTAHALLVMCQNRGCGPGDQIPRADLRVRSTRHHLRLSRLCGHAVHGTAMPAQGHDLRLGADIPHTADRVATAREDDIQCGMCGDAVHTAQMAVVVADDLVVLQVPALDGLVLTAGEEVRRPGGDGHSAHCV